MTSVAPPPPPPPPLGNGSAAQLTVTLSTQASAQLAKLPIDSLINGLIKPPATPQGLPILQTNLGPILFKPPFILPPNAQVTFKLVQSLPVVQIQLTHVNAKPIPTNTPAARINTLATQFMQTAGKPVQTQSQTAQHTPGAVLSNAATPATLLNINTAQGLRAFVLPNPLNKPQQATQAQTNTQAGKTQAPSTQAQQQAPSTNLLSATMTKGGIGQISQTGHTLFQAGNQLNVRILSVQQPGQQTSSTAQAASSASSTSSVITQGTAQGSTPSGQPIIRIPQGQIALDTSAKFPDGSLVKLEILSSQKPVDRPALTSAAQSQSNIQALTKQWPALEEALSTLRETNPALADQLSNGIIPKADARLAASMLFFLKALRIGKFKSWSNEETLRALSRSKPELSKTLEKDFSNLSEKSKATNTTDWKIAYVPMQNNEKIDQIRIAQRDHKENEHDGKDDPGIRFVIDVDLSRLGAMQFDGLAKNKQKKFDLIVRTHAALPGYMRKDIHDIYEEGMMAVGFEGKINFQVTPNFIQVEENEMQTNAINLGMLV